MRNVYLLLFLLLCFPALSFAQPAIVFNSVQHDFGVVSKTDSLNHTFEFANTGSEDLIISRVVPS